MTAHWLTLQAGNTDVLQAVPSTACSGTGLSQRLAALSPFTKD